MQMKFREILLSSLLVLALAGCATANKGGPGVTCDPTHPSGVVHLAVIVTGSGNNCSDYQVRTNPPLQRVHRQIDAAHWETSKGAMIIKFVDTTIPDPTCSKIGAIYQCQSTGFCNDTGAPLFLKYSVTVTFSSGTSTLSVTEDPVIIVDP